MIPLPKLLDANLMESRRIRPFDVSIYEKMIPLSYASMQLTENEDIPELSYFELFTPNGSAGIYRTKKRPKEYGDTPPTVELEHAVTEIGDYLIRADIQEEKTLSAAFTAMFAHYRGDRWQLGSIPYTDTVILDANYEPILQVMLSVLEQVPQYYLTFDFSTTPWTLSLAQRGTAVAAEGRLSRNVERASVTPDETELYTRVYVKGLPLHSGQSDGDIGYMDADTIGTYGVKEYQLSASDDLTAEQAARKATVFLEKHKRPKLAISIAGADFSSETGETLDQVAIGKLYRLAVPKYKTTVEENVTGINWKSVYRNPKSVQIDLADETDPVVDYLRKQREAARSGGRSAGNRMNDFYNELYSEDGLIHSIIWQTATMIRMEVGDAVSGIYGSVIEQTATYIRTEVRDAASRIAQSVIEQTADYVHTEVSDIASGVAWSVVHQTMTGIFQEVARKATVYVQLTDPNDGINVLRDGDIWIFSAKRTWGELAEQSWDATSQRKWKEYYGALQYIWRNGRWVKIVDEPAVVEARTWVDQDSDHYAIMAEMLDTMGESYNSNLTVTAQKISADVSTAKSQIYSSISQTATNINLHVEDKIRGVQSNIEQTADRITASVSAAKSMLWSQIEQTATGIMLQVNDDINDLHSAIEQTSTNIHMSVSTAKSALYSAINISATGIMQEVVDRDNDLQSAIRQTSTNIHISVSTAKSTLYSAINVTATGIMQDVVDRDNDLRSAIRQTSTNIHISVSTAKSALYGAIEVTATGIMQDVVDRDNDLRSAIVQTSTNIHISVSAAKSSLYGAINVTSTGIMQEVVNKESNLRSAIVASSTQISLRVEKGEVISSINQTAETITISASKINLDGYVKATDITASYLSAKIADITLVEVKGLNSYGTIRSTGGSVVGADIAFGSGSGSGFSSWSLKNFIKELKIAQSGNTYTLQKKAYNDENWVNVGSFSRAVTSFGLSWSGGMATVTAQPQGNTYSFALAQGTASWNGRTVSIPINWSEGGQYSSATGYTASATYVMAKADISATRGSVSSRPPSADASLTKITAAGWYLISVTAAGTTKTFGIQVDI